MSGGLSEVPGVRLRGEDRLNVCTVLLRYFMRHSSNEQSRKGLPNLSHLMLPSGAFPGLLFFLQVSSPFLLRREALVLFSFPLQPLVFQLLVPLLPLQVCQLRLALLYGLSLVQRLLSRGRGHPEAAVTQSGKGVAGREEARNFRKVQKFARKAPLRKTQAARVVESSSGLSTPASRTEFTLTVARHVSVLRLYHAAHQNRRAFAIKEWPRKKTPKHGALSACA